jgi:hypothetical protein
MSLIGSMDNPVPTLNALRRALLPRKSSRDGKCQYGGISGDNPILDLLIEGGTKALRRGLMSGETLRAPRQQLRWYVPRPSTSSLVSRNPSNQPSEHDLLIPDAFTQDGAGVCLSGSAAPIERLRQLPGRSEQ